MIDHPKREKKEAALWASVRWHAHVEDPSCDKLIKSSVSALCKFTIALRSFLSWGDLRGNVRYLSRCSTVASRPIWLSRLSKCPRGTGLGHPEKRRKQRRMGAPRRVRADDVPSRYYLRAGSGCPEDVCVSLRPRPSVRRLPSPANLPPTATRAALRPPIPRVHVLLQVESKKLKVESWRC